MRQEDGKKNSHDSLRYTLPAEKFVLAIGIWILLWAFGSYVIYVFSVDGAVVCFPPVDGCVPVTRAGNYKISGIYYRAMILPAVAVLGISNYFILQYTDSKASMSVMLKKFLTVAGVWTAVFSLALTEAMVDGIEDTPHIYTTLHRFFAFFAFLSITLFASAVSWILHRIKLPGNSRGCIVLFAGLFMVVLPHLSDAEHPARIGEWNLLIVLSIWYINFYFIMKENRAKS